MDFFAEALKSIAESTMANDKALLEVATALTDNVKTLTRLLELLEARVTLLENTLTEMQRKH